MEEKHPIQVVARRTGLTPDVLRAWERRYEAILPERSPGSRRLYSSEDIERLILLRRLTQGGRGIGDIARLPTERLRKMLRDDEEAVRRVRPAAPAPRDGAPRGAGDGRRTESGIDAAGHLESCVDAVGNLDVVDLEARIDGAYLALGQIAAIERVILPLMRAIGDRWRDGRIRVVHEHLASAVVRTVVSNMGRVQVAPASAPTLIVTTPAGQQHELGALVAATTAASEGWQVVYLGPNLPAEEIAAAARQKGAGAIALSLVYPADDPRVAEELVRLRTLVPGTTAILVGGPAASGYRDALRIIGAVHLDDMKGMRRALERLRGRTS